MAVDEGLRTRPLVFVSDLDRPELAPDDRHHLERALRLRRGDAITLGDGAGRWRSARLGSPLELVGGIDWHEAPVPLLTVAFTPVKGERPEWFVQKLTEIGVDVIAPVFTKRSVVRWDAAKADRQRVRCAKVAREASMQSRRLHLPTILPPADLATFVQTHPDAVLADPSGRVLEPAHQTIVIGPEGGFDEAERLSRPLVSLPGNVLRAETAALAAAVSIAGFRTGRFT